MNRAASRRYVVGIVILFVGIALASVPDASARWGGGGFGGGGFGGGFRGFGGGGGGGFHGFGGGGGGGFHGFGGDGFGGGTMNHSYSGGNSWDHQNSQYKSGTGQSDYNTYNANQMAEQQSKYNEANSLQHNQEETSEYEHTQSMNTINNNVGNTNWNGGNPYSSCCYDGGGGSSTGEVLGAAALGAVGGMAVGSMMTSAAQAPTTTVIQTAPPYGYPSAPVPLGTTLYSLPPGAYSTTINGGTYYVAGPTYYRSYFNGSQVIYVATNPY